MEIEVSYTAHFASLQVIDGGMTFDTGLLDDGERLSLTKSLLSAAEQLTPDDHDAFKRMVCEMFDIGVVA